MCHLKITVSSLCLRQLLTLYYHVVVTLENAIKLVSIKVLPNTRLHQNLEFDLL